MACAELATRVGELAVASLSGRAAAAQARALAAGGRRDEAIVVLEQTVDALDASRLPWLRVALLVDLARHRSTGGDRAGAAADAIAARAALAGLDVVLAPDDVELLARLAGDPPERPAAVATLRTDGTCWTATFDGTSSRLADTKGLRYLAELIAEPGRERHALDLVDRIEGVQPGVDRRALGDAGPLLDSAARAAYRRRIEELRADVADALEAEALDTAEARQAELDELVRQLAQAFGVGGRARRAGSAAERSRLNVTRALRSAIARLVETVPPAGAVLDRGVRTGTYCVYLPDEGAGIRWIVQRGVNTSRIN